MSKLKEQYVNFWNKTKNGNSRLSFYNTVTDNYCLQTYLNECKVPKHRVALSRLRLSAHDLEIERGRYSNLAPNDRTCRLCQAKEDELHFLDHCPLYENLRPKFLADINQKLSMSNKYTSPSSLMSLDHGQRELAKFVFECFEIRKQYICCSRQNTNASTNHTAQGDDSVSGPLLCP